RASRGARRPGLEARAPPRARVRDHGRTRLRARRRPVLARVALGALRAPARTALVGRRSPTPPRHAREARRLRRPGGAAPRVALAPWRHRRSNPAAQSRAGARARRRGARAERRSPGRDAAPALPRHGPDRPDSVVAERALAAR